MLQGKVLRLFGDNFKYRFLMGIFMVEQFLMYTSQTVGPDSVPTGVKLYRLCPDGLFDSAMNSQGRLPGGPSGVAPKDLALAAIPFRLNLSREGIVTLDEEPEIVVNRFGIRRRIGPVSDADVNVFWREYCAEKEGRGKV